MRSFMVAMAAILLLAPPAHADPTINPPLALFAAPTHDPWDIDWLSLELDTTPLPLRLTLTAAPLPEQAANTQPVHAVAIEHSDAYQMRAKIHKYASFATIPLFAGELLLGQSVYNSSNEGRGGGSNKGAHVAVGSGIIGLFAVNAVTGLWNLLGEDRQQTEGRTLRITHSLLMLAANAGFIATWATAPDGGDASAKSTHRAIAFTSIGVGTVGYLLMLLGIDVFNELLESWNSIYSNSAALRTGIAFTHISGLVAGGGCAITADLATITAARAKSPALVAQLRLLKRTHAIVLIGLVAIVVSGVLLMAADFDTYVVSRLFWLKMGLMVVLLVNGVLLVRSEKAATHVHAEARAWTRLHRIATASLILWLLTTLAGAALPNLG